MPRFLTLLLLVLFAVSPTWARPLICADGARCDADHKADGVCTLDICLRPRLVPCGCASVDCCTIPRLCRGDASARAHVVLSLSNNHGRPVKQTVQVGGRFVRVRCRHRPPPAAAGAGRRGRERDDDDQEDD